MRPFTILKRSFDSVRLRFASPNSAHDDIIGILGIFVFLILSVSESCEAQTAGKYEFYRYEQRYAIEIDPLGELLGRVSAQFEDRLDPNFTRVYEFVYQRNVGDKTITGYYPESGVSVAAIERIYLVDNAAMLGQHVGVGAGLGLINETISLRMTAEIGYKFAFGGGKGNYFIEPRLMMDAYLITNHDGKRILPYVSLPFGYAWW